MLGVLLIRKPGGITSHDVVNAVRRRLGTKRVGHAGTLDPLATGLLVIAVGPATRFLQYLPLEPKEYVGEITFGQATDSYDSEGEPTTGGPVPPNLAEAIQRTLPQFMGLIQQIPPMYSAVKVGGKPLYKYARAGEQLEREPRTVHVGTFDLLAVAGSAARVRVVCSGGTYIRTLAHDLGQTIGCGAHLTKLERTAVGRFNVDLAIDLDDVSLDKIIPLREALPPMPIIELNDRQTANVREGRMIALPEPTTEKLFALIEPSGEVFSVARVQGDFLQPECVIPAEVVHDPV